VLCCVEQRYWLSLGLGADFVGDGDGDMLKCDANSCAAVKKSFFESG
jgi:hypothetical protein